MYFIREIKDQKLVKSTPNFPVYIDSPLAKAATTVFCGDLHGYLDEQALELVKDGTHMFTFPNLNLVESSEESKMLNMDTTPKVIISASGMCDAGRIRHHLKHNLWRANSTVVFVGFQSPSSPYQSSTISAAVTPQDHSLVCCMVLKLSLIHIYFRAQAHGAEVPRRQPLRQARGGSGVAA